MFGHIGQLAQELTKAYEHNRRLQKVIDSKPPRDMGTLQDHLQDVMIERNNLLEENRMLKKQIDEHAD
jgi:hypothetical protein